MLLTSKIRDQVFVHLPLGSFAEYQSKIADHQLNVEILITAEDIDSQPLDSIEKVARFLSEHQLSCTIHGPFLDLAPGSSDRLIRQVTQERYRQLLALVSPLTPRVIVFHAAFDPLFYGDSAQTWLKQSLETWLPIAEAVEKMRGGGRIALENVLEREPQIIHELLLKVDSPSVGVCLDIGHAHIFSSAPVSDWIKSLGSKIFEFHLHDNHGQWDEHLALGEGNIDIAGLLKEAQEAKICAALTIEAVNEEQAMLSLQRLGSYLRP